MAPAQSNARCQPKPIREKRAKPAKAGSLGGKTTYNCHFQRDAAAVAGANPTVMAKLTDDLNVIINDDVSTSIKDLDPYNIIDADNCGGDTPSESF